MTNGPLPSPNEIDSDTQAFLLSTVAISVAVWDVAFFRGIFEVIFFDKVFTIWAAERA